ncbi:thioredoxin family protein [Brachyspira innocens]|uniref:Thioredoxin family protein n=1 Tax=Brachyspira innocens TaxID=13264 RepID=A0ABT8YZ21_9SPIR|nr:thioredoxin fold domain-containing protein [Brachyspira innocens]MDO6992607.1 thioredoxin family protein [Brachyspira innocens]MDO7020477.1 thioredoxin family protein [Brachyspira innocens]
MNKKILVVLITVLSVIACSKANAEIKWEKDLASAMKKAKEKNLPIMIDVYTDWCTWCKELDKNTYANKEVIDMAKKMVSVKLNPETSKEGAEIAQRYGVQGFPTILFISADGFVLENIGGYVEGEKFVPYMKNAIEKLNKINIVLASKEPSLEKLDLYLESGNEEEAKKIYDVLMDRKAISNEAMAKYLLGFGLIKAQKRDYEKANEYFDNIIKNYPKSEEVYVAHYYKVVIMALAGEKDEPKKYLEKLIDDPKVPANMKAQYESLLSYINEKN